MNILDKITFLRQKRNWTEYQLAMRSGLPQSTISSWYRKNLQPSIASLEKICNAFQITLSQFFEEDTKTTSLNAEQRELLKYWSRLTSEQKDAVLQLLKTL